MPVNDELAPETDPENKERARVSWPRRIAKIGGITVATIVGLVVAVLFLLDTGPGRRFIVDQIQALEFENGMKIGIGRIEGSIYGEMILHDLSVKDPRGEFVYSPEVHVDWRPFAFIRNHVDVRSLTADRLVLRRLPEFKETPPTDEPLLPDMDIDVGRLRIANFIAEEEVSGERRVAGLSGKAHIADGRAQVEFDAQTIVAAERAGGDRISLVLDAVPEANRLALNLKLNAPQGGVIAALSGLSEPLVVRVDGQGDWQKWDGTLNADLDGAELTRLNLTARDGTFSIKGPTRLARLVEGQFASLLGPITEFDLTAALDERRADLSGNISSDAFRLGVNGLVDLSDNSFEDLKLAFVLLRPSALASNLSGSGLRAMLTLNDEFATPTVQYEINANRIVMNDMGLERFSASGAAEVDAERILIPVDARAARITGLDTVAGGTLANVRLNGDVAIDGARILSDNMRIRSDRIDATAILLADMSTGLYSGAIDGRINNYRVESVGIFNIETDVELNASDTGFALEGRVRARSTRLLNASLQDYLGGNFVASSDVSYGSDGAVRFSNLRLEAPDLRVVGGRGLYSPDGRIALVVDGVSDRYGAIGVRVAGTITDPNARITAEHPDLGIGLANLEAEITGARNGYRLDMTADTDYGPLQADVILGIRGPTTLMINSANLSGIEFAGSLEQTNAGPFAGTLTANGNGVGGVVKLQAEGRYQEALFNLRANDTVFSGPANARIGSAIIDGRVVLYDQPYVVADAQLSDTYLAGFDLNAGRVLINYRNGQGHAKALIEGRTGAPFRLSANADLRPDLWRVALDGKVRGIAVKTASPARIIPGDEGYELLPTKITFGGGTVRLAGEYGSNMKLQSRLEGVDLALFNTFLPGLGMGGKATGSLDFVQAGSTAFPRADARLTIDDFTRTTAVSVSQPVDINFVGKLLEDGAEARAVIRRRGSVIGRLVATLRPASSGSGPWTTRMQEARLGGGMRYNGPADTLFSFAGLADQRLSGNIGVAADFSCQVSNPCLAGVVRGSNLTYENHTYGTHLTNMKLSGRFSGDRFLIEELTASAGDGSLSAKGYASLAAESGYPMDISVALEQARLARSDAISAQATGQLRLTKSAGETALLSGKLLLPETRYKVVTAVATEVPELTGVRFKPPKGRQPISGEEQVEAVSGGFSSLVRLDIDLRAPDRLYVSGMGLESEWKADFNVSGTSAAPRMAGEVTLIRGTLGFAGRSFELTRGLVSFTGGETIDPVVRIVATEEVEDITVNVDVSGRAMNPQISFSSVPSLPDDEVLSRILFGSSIANLSTLQAVQLAASLNSLRGSGGGLNPLGKLRSATGVDRLRILGPDEDNGRGTALAAGQYLTDDIYVELITDARGFTATQLEISLTSWLSLLSQAGGSGVSNVNLRIKKDY